MYDLMRANAPLVYLICIVLLAWAVTVTASYLALRRIYEQHISDAREARKDDREVHRANMSALASALAYGTPEKQEAVIADPAPDAEDRVNARVREDTINAGVIALVNEHAAKGIVLSEDEARLQVQSMLLGNVPVVQGLGTERFRD